MIMPENITNEMFLRSNGKWFGRMEEEEEEEEAEEEDKLSARYYITQSLILLKID